MDCANFSLLLYFIINFSNFVLPAAVVKTELENSSLLSQAVKYLYQIDLSNHTQLISAFYGEDYGFDKLSATKTRFKRQGKFGDAANMGQAKLVKLQLQMFKNLFVTNPVGIPHPLHPMAPKTVMQLVREKLLGSYSPDMDVPPKAQK